MPRPSLTDACTKIVATVGPACSTPEVLRQLIETGVDVFRVNTAHGDRGQHEQVVRDIRRASDEAGYPVAILFDLAGPKIRLGALRTDPYECLPGAMVRFIRKDQAQADNEFTSTYARLIDELAVGDRVMLADGTVSLIVESVGPDYAECRVTAGGSLRSRQGINLPGVKLSVSAMLPRDVDNAIWAAKNQIDFVSLSFVRSAADVQGLKQLLSEHNSDAQVIAKIEKPEALQQLESIVDASDGVMVARGDLGVEIDVAETPIAQKRIIRVCHQKMKPVIVATQMLESMHHSSRPTRAEVSDVANAILDGTDACMLSGETAIGDHPAKAVEMMNRIMLSTEREMLEHHGDEFRLDDRVHAITAAVTRAATEVAESIDAKLMVIATRSGNTARVKSQSRSRIPTLAASDSLATLRRINLLWGIKPIKTDFIEDPSALIDEVLTWAQAHGKLSRGDRVVFVLGSGVFEKAHNLVLVQTVK
jgi:pyruvate kinase